MEDGFNCFIFYMGSLDKCCFLFQKLFEKWFSTDAESLQRFAAHARSACSLAVAGCENTFFNKWVKSFKPGYVPEKERGLAQVPAFCTEVLSRPLWSLFASFRAALQHGKSVLAGSIKDHFLCLLSRHNDIPARQTTAFQ